LPNLRKAFREIRGEVESPEYQERVKKAQEANWYHSHEGKRETIPSKPEGDDSDWPKQAVRPENHSFYDYRGDRDLSYEEKALAKLPREVA
jgi:hypothetical protein